MIEYLRNNWWIYWGIAASVAVVWFRFRRTDATRSRADRMRPLLTGQRYVDPRNSSYDPGFFKRQALLLLIGLPLIAFAYLIVWLLGK